MSEFGPLGEELNWSGLLASATSGRWAKTRHFKSEVTGNQRRSNSTRGSRRGQGGFRADRRDRGLTSVRRGLKSR